MLLPTIVIYEVVKYMTIWATKNNLEECIHTFHGVTTVPLTEVISYSAVELSRKHKLPLADSIIYATSLKMNATLWTQDKHFKDIEGVKFFSK